MQDPQQLSTAFLAAAIWAIFIAGMLFWTPPPAPEGVRFAAGTEPAAHRAILRRAAASAAETRR